VCVCMCVWRNSLCHLTIEVSRSHIIRHN